nr:MAG TPA: hypothetical protein [Caudoviricetes sp.]
MSYHRIRQRDLSSHFRGFSLRFKSHQESSESS